MGLIPFSSSAAYLNIANGGVIPIDNFFGSSSPFTLTLTNLSIGQDYLFQTWVNDSRGSVGTRSMNVTGGANTSGTLAYNSTTLNGGNGSFVIGTFKADALIQAITYSAVVGGVAQFGAFQVRAVPEPASFTLFCLGLAGLIGIARRRGSR